MNYLKIVFFIIGISCVVITPAFSQTVHEDYCNAFFYPHELTSDDVLQDGPSGPGLKISGKTALIWVDLEPEMDFCHPSYYILISQDTISIEKGKMWPVLNGKTILINEIRKYTLLSPLRLDSGNDYSISREWIDVHIYPHELTLRDKLIDGLSGNQVRVYPNTLLLWVDLMPFAKFAHPTAYVLISKHGTRVEKGSWWPVLNGKQICYGEQNQTGVISPFKVFRLLLDSEDVE
ncbi:MAG: hypothetical protein JXJ04_17790 [Spirochaetales bacterium]|nr:hypothetical protein [Spirochaetales bacterium]